MPSVGSALLSMVAVGLMGFAIQRGGTCTVAAVDEILSQRRAHRLVAMLEASLWVVGGLALAQLAQWSGSMPGGHDVTRWTVVGGVLLGLGAWINGACVFGAIARLGSGQWAQAFTPVGFFFGCLSVTALLRSGRAGESTTPPTPSPLWMAADWLVPAFVFYALWRVGPGFLASLRDPGAARRWAASAWAPHAATIVIGITFVVTLLLAGPWAYTDVLARSAQGIRDGMATGDWHDLALPAALFVALYLGALIGGWSAGRWSPTAPTLPGLIRAVLGGALMGWGSLLIPGSNDGLILIGIPLMKSYAWLAFASMVLAIAAALLVQRAWSARRSAA
jgi:uncharacterized membrane protein YedE/YeeE